MTTTIPDSHWTNGLCSNFADGLQRRFGGELWAVVNHSRACDDDYLLHAYCIIDGLAYDANGHHTIEFASDCSVWPIPDMDKDHDVVIVWKQVDTDWFAAVHEDYNPGYLPQVDEYIDRNRHLFPRRG